MELNDKKIVDPSWGMCISLWWSFVWRSFVWGSIVGLLLGLLLAYLGKLAGINPGLVWFIVWRISIFLMGIFVFKRILIKKYRNFEIYLVQK